MNKAELVEALAVHFDGNKAEAGRALKAVLDTITAEMAKGEKVSITGFGVFEKLARPARMVRNPRTGERKRAKATHVPRFRPGSELKAVMSGEKKLPKPAKTAAKPATKAAAPTARKATAAKTTTTKTAAAKRTAPAKTTVAKTTTAKRTAATKTAPAKAAARKTATKAVAAKSTAAKTTAAKKATPAKRTAAKKTAK